MIKIHNILNNKHNQNQMVEKLSELYNGNWDNCKSSILEKVECALPFLIAPTNEYCSSSKRIMIIGQETNSWGGEMYGESELQTPENLMNLYDIFVNIDRGYNSPYWNFIKNIQNLISSDTKVVVNNIVKVGKKRGMGCDDYINNLTLQHFNVLLKEIEILKPNLLLFLTGPNYDARIKATLGDMNIVPVVQSVFPSINERQFAEIKFINDKLPTAYRCYHPGYLKRSRNFENYMNIILDLIEKVKE